MMKYFQTQLLYNENFKLLNSADQFFFYNKLFCFNNPSNLTQLSMTVYSLFKDFTPTNVKYLISWLFLQEQLFGINVFRFSISRYKLKRDHRISVTLVCELSNELIYLKVIPLLFPNAFANLLFATVSTNRYSAIDMLFTKKLALSYSLKNFRYFFRFFEASPFIVHTSITHSFLKHNLISKSIVSYCGFLIL
jgi:hypothetical protein